MLLNNKFLSRTGIFLFMLLVALPFVIGFIYAVLYATGLTGILATGFTLTPFFNVIVNGEFVGSILYSFYIAFSSIIIAVLITGSIIIIYKDSLVKSKSAFILYLPLSIPAIVAAFLSFQLMGKSGFFSRIFFHAHFINNIQQFPDLINDKFAAGIIITHALMAIPFFLVYFSNIYQSEKVNELTLIAFTLGASVKQSIINILIPIIWKKAKPAIFLYFIFILGSYEIPLILGRQTPQMISVLILRKAQHFNLMDIPQAYAVAIIYTIVVLITLFFFLRSNKTIRA